MWSDDNCCNVTKPFDIFCNDICSSVIGSNDIASCCTYPCDTGSFDTCSYNICSDDIGPNDINSEIQAFTKLIKSNLQE
jgi:hypothetical protein